MGTLFRVLIIADPKIPVPPTKYGGTERIVALLARQLQRKGHVVDLLAGPDSQSFGGKLAVHRLPTSNYGNRLWRKVLFQFLSLRLACRADVVINFGRIDYLETILRTAKPLICSFQNPVEQFEVDWLLSRRDSSLAFVGISASQIETLQPRDRFSVIHNSTDVKSLRFSPIAKKPPYLAFLGRITYKKGADTAIKIARCAGMKLKLGGTISDEPGGQEFFEKRIRPELGEQIEWIGPVDDAAKQDLLGGATAMLFPIRWSEPFGIVMSESLACGTPVIATRSASTPEVIQDGETGFLCDSEEDLVTAVRRVSELDRTACRRSAEEKFSSEIMATNYLEVIGRLLMQGRRKFARC